MSGWLIAGIVVSVIVLLIVLGWIRHIIGVRRFDARWEKMTDEEKRKCQEQAYRDKI